MNYSDIPAAMRLKEAAGWNQTEDDWFRLLSLAPESCFGVDCDGVLASTMTAISYGNDLAWIGMVLTAPEFRNRGFARALLKQTLEYLRGRGVLWAKLDATEMGAGLYSDFNFEFECRVERWSRPATRGAHLDEGGLSKLAELTAIMHRDVFGTSRAPLLNALLRSGGASVNESGFALWRGGSSANHFGPCVAANANGAEDLLRCCLRANAGAPLIWDLAPQNAAAAQLATKYGFKEARKLSRMACRLQAHAKPLHSAMESIFAIAGFEYG